MYVRNILPKEVRCNANDSAGDTFPHPFYLTSYSFFDMTRRQEGQFPGNRTDLTITSCFAVHQDVMSGCNHVGSIECPRRLFDAEDVRTNRRFCLE